MKILFVLMLVLSFGLVACDNKSDLKPVDGSDNPVEMMKDHGSD